MTETAEPRGSFWIGIGAAFGLDILVPMALSIGFTTVMMPLRLMGATHFMALSMIPAFASFGIGLAQWLWLVPFARAQRRKGKPEFAKGLMTGGWIVFLLNAGCWGLLLSGGLGRIGG